MYTLNCKGKLLTINKPLVMGILNTTPDSFYAHSRVNDETDILQRAEQMLEEGADILDIGGQSTRPGSERISAEAEADRVTGAIAAVHRHFPDAIISVDTYYASVAEQAVQAGASIINDISAGTLDAGMLVTAGRLEVPYVCMHIKGTPDDMQRAPHYDNFIDEVLDFLVQKTDACRQAGIQDIIIDPGFGFGKTTAHNFELVRRLEVFKMLRYPILLGVSRKGSIYRTLDITAAEALNGTTVLNTIGLLHGADILRVHDVKEAREAVKLVGEVVGSDRL